MDFDIHIVDRVRIQSGLWAWINHLHVECELGISIPEIYSLVGFRLFNDALDRDWIRAGQVSILSSGDLEVVGVLLVERKGRQWQSYNLGIHDVLAIGCLLK